MKKKTYIVPTIETVIVQMENLLNNPSTWSVDDGPKINIADADPADEEPTGAKRWHGTLADWDTWD